MITSAPRALGTPSVLQDRLAMRRSSPTAATLTTWVNHLIDRRTDADLNAEIPMIDPADGGTKSRVLLLMEAPGPMTNAQNEKPGSGFISSDNDDGTAENLWRARRAAHLLDDTLLWNAVPWYLGPASTKPKIRDLHEGAVPLRELIRMLPELHTVVALGRFAQKGWARFGRPNLGIGLRTIETWHPSPLAMNQSGKRDHLVAALTKANRDWRGDDASNRKIVAERDSAQRVVAHWYANKESDRIDLHPRWW